MMEFSGTCNIGHRNTVTKLLRIYPKLYKGRGQGAVYTLASAAAARPSLQIFAEQLGELSTLSRSH